MVTSENKTILAEYYTRQELADELGISPRSLQRYAWLRTGPVSTKVGGRIYYHKDAVRDWLRKQSEVTA